MFNFLNMNQPQRSSFHLKLSQDFGRKALDLFRFIERRYISDAKWSNNLHFNLSLKRFQIFPVSLSISSAVKGPRAEKILFKAKRSLLTERIRQTHISIKNIRRDREEAESEMISIVGAATFAECMTRFRSAYRHHFNKTRDEQKHKLSRLIAEQKHAANQTQKQLKSITREKAEEIKKKWIFNTSSKTLTQAHLNVLTKGLAFTPTPKKPPTLDFIVSIESGARQLGLQSDATSALRSSAARALQHPPALPPNITAEERQAIRGLKDDDSISVHPADKGRATVIMDKEDYHRKMDVLVGDNTTYEKLAADPTQHHRATIMATLLPMQNYLPPSLYHRLSPSTTAQPPLMFGQPKVHKPGMPLRPIVSCRNSIFSALTKECGRILGPLVGNTPHHLKDSMDLVKKLRDVKLPSNYTLCSFDLCDMYTNIPQGRAMELLRDKLEADPDLSKRTPIRKNDILALVKLDLDLAYFRWKGEFYKQKKGFGMGKSTSSPMSDIYMEDFEAAALSNYPTGDDTTSPSDIILFWVRKADDTLTAIRNDHIQPLHDYLNSIHPDVQWTKEVEKEGRIAMLDVTIIRN